MAESCYRIEDVWECGVCGRQTAKLEGEPPFKKPPICDFGHRRVEMEQRNPEAFNTAFQYSSMPDSLPDGRTSTDG